MDSNHQRLTINPIAQGNFDPNLEAWIAPGPFKGELPNVPPLTSPSGFSAASIAPSSAIESAGGSVDPYGGHNAQSKHSRERSNTSNSKSQHGDGDAPNPPPWADMKTKAGKDRKRLPLACIACRRKKIRCSGEKPACKHCMKSRVPCVYKVTTRKATPRTDYMAMLDKRLKRMEDRVIKMIPKEEQTIALKATPRAIVKPQANLTHRSSKRSADEAFNAELKNWARSGGDPAQKNVSNGVQVTKVQELEDEVFMKKGQEHLPSQEIQEHLAEVYFDYVYGQSYLLLHKPSYMRQLRTRQLAPALSLAVCGISARFSDHPQLQTEPSFVRGQTWANAAQDIVLEHFDTPSVTSCIILLLLSLHGFGTCQGGRSWMCSGLAHRMAYALQLNKDPTEDDSQTNSTFLCQEARRRTLWSCFVNDRFNSSGTSRPMSMGEELISCRLPVKESLWLLEHPGKSETLEGNLLNPPNDTVKPSKGDKNVMGLASYNVRLIAIWGRLVQYLNLGGRLRDSYHLWDRRSGWQSLSDQLSDFKAKLPEDLQYNADNLAIHAAENLANQFLYLHIALNQLILFLYQFAFPTTNVSSKICDGMPNPFIKAARQAALEAAASISNLVDEALEYRCVVPFAGYAAYTSSAVHIYSAFSKNATLEEASKKHLRKNMRYLHRMKKYWGMFNFHVQNLKELYRTHENAARDGLSTPEPQSGKISQYGDWHEKYPKGPSERDYQEALKDEKTDERVLGPETGTQSMQEFFAELSPSAVPKAQNKRPKKAAVRNNATGAPNPVPTPTNSQAPDRRASMPNTQPEFSPYGIPNHPSYQLPEHFDRTQITPQPPQQMPSSSSSNYLQSSTSVPSNFGSMAHMQPPGMVSNLSDQSSMHSNFFDNPMANLDPSETDFLSFGAGQYGQDFLNSTQPNGAWFAPFNFDISEGLMDMQPELMQPAVPQQDAGFSNLDQKMHNGG